VSEESAIRALVEALERYTGTDAPALLEEARQEARARARSLLADAMTESLLTSARRQVEAESTAQASSPVFSRPSRSPQADPEPGSDEGLVQPGSEEGVVQPGSDEGLVQPASEEGVVQPGSDEGLGWYVYCIVGSAAVELDGIDVAIDDAHPVTLIRHGGLGAVASEVSLEEFGEVPMRERLDDLGWLEQTARTHEQVLDGVREQTTVVPMRLCTVYRSEQSVAEMLVREAPVLEATLERLRGKTEWGVKMFVFASELAKELEQGGEGEPEDPLAEARPGEAYMLNRRREALRKENVGKIVEERCEAAHGLLAAVASEAMLNRLQPAELSGHAGEMTLNGAYLVDDEEAEAFAELVERLQQEYAPALEVELTGPWPPYNFVTSSVEVGG
jgi:hypothetical protein